MPIIPSTVDASCFAERVPNGVRPKRNIAKVPSKSLTTPHVKDASFQTPEAHSSTTLHT